MPDAARQAEPGAGGRPRLAPGVRLHWDARRNAWLLLAPERVVEMEGPAPEIIRLCDGHHTVDDIVAALAAAYDAPLTTIAEDVGAMLAELEGKRMIIA